MRSSFLFQSMFFNAPKKFMIASFSFLKLRMTSEKLWSFDLSFLRKSYASFFTDILMLVMGAHNVYSYISVSARCWVF